MFFKQVLLLSYSFQPTALSLLMINTHPLTQHQGEPHGSLRPTDRLALRQPPGAFSYPTRKKVILHPNHVLASFQRRQNLGESPQLPGILPQPCTQKAEWLETCPGPRLSESPSGTRVVGLAHSPLHLGQEQPASQGASSRAHVAGMGWSLHVKASAWPLRAPPLSGPGGPLTRTVD